MLFSSIVFIVYFFPIVLLLYFLFSFSTLLQNMLLLFASLLFYGWGEPVYVFLMIASILVNSVFGYLIEWVPHHKKLWLWTSVVVNLAALFYFKYFSFVLKNLAYLSIPVSAVRISLPIGISFFTFQAMSYVIDVYRGKVHADNPFNVGLYISFFPQLIAGPIVQYATISDQLKKRKISFSLFSIGISRFLVGFIKKIMLANAFAGIADNIFNFSQLGVEKFVVPASLAWLGAIAYTLQIFFDFSAYSDMAIGLGLCFGFRFPENFNYPYIAATVSDFWRRWHISLTSWFREYVYFPLGGSRVENRDDMVRNMFVVWLLTGIWHGANWTFIFWGLYYFVFQLMERFLGWDQQDKKGWIYHLYTMVIVIIGWVVFRAEDLYQAGRFLMNMFGLNHNGFWSDMTWMFLKENTVVFLAGILFCLPVARQCNEYLYWEESRWSGIFAAAYPVVLIGLFWLCMGYLANGSYNPFIYFNF